MRHCILNYADFSKKHFCLSLLCRGPQPTLMFGILDTMPSAQYTPYFTWLSYRNLELKKFPQICFFLRSQRTIPPTYLSPLSETWIFRYLPVFLASHMQLLVESCSFCLRIICDTDPFSVHHCHSQASPSPLTPSLTKSISYSQRTF